ncbi:MAG TPA: hypothetical protein VMW87_03070 [Spirochaetia bacterium]|nr:hypothetical protein [Spirochaetia bacterium]
MGIVSYALLCADRVITENNGKKGVIGVFSGFQFPAFPSPPTHWFIYAGLANLGAKQDFSLNLVHEESQHVLFSLGGDLNTAEGNRDVELVVPVANLIFQKPGTHILTLNIGGMPVASRVLRVTPAPHPQNSN